MQPARTYEWIVIIIIAAVVAVALVGAMDAVIAIDTNNNAPFWPQVYIHRRRSGANNSAGRPAEIWLWLASRLSNRKQ